MDALLALREAIVHGASITEQPTALVVNEGGEDEVTIPKSVTTPFRKGGGGHYTIDGLWIQHLYKELRHGELMKEYDKRGVDKLHAVIVSDKNSVLQYLQGAYDGADHIDREFVSAAPTVVRAAGAAAAALTSVTLPSARGGAGGGELDPATALAAAHAAMRAERPLRTRVTIMDVPGQKNLSEIVFNFFKHGEATGGAGGAVGAPKSKRGRDGAAPVPGGPSGGDAKKPRVGMGLPFV